MYDILLGGCLCSYEEEMRRMNNIINEKGITVKDMPTEQRPYEKCIHIGEEYLTDAELLGVIIRSGYKGGSSIELAKKVLCCNNGAGFANLFNMTLNELTCINGIGSVKAVQLKCIAELTKRISRMDIKYGEDFSSPQKAAAYFMQHMRFLKQETVVIAMLDSRSRLIKDLTVSSGTINSSVASTREVFVPALKNNALSIILLHNHPSGDPSPSREDMYVTTRMKEAGEIIGIALVDHIIIGDNCYYSMKEAGYI